MPNKFNQKIQLDGFNNLTKSLCFNIYDICYAQSETDRNEYLEYIDEQYNAERLTDILRNVTQIIGAEILNTARQDYDPQGASVTMLVAEGLVAESQSSKEETPGPKDELPPPVAIVSHLDKSHIAAHTYPEYHPDNGICTFRADIDVATCGLITPLKALNYLIHSFDSDVVTIDYRVRGFTRDTEGKKHYIDHEVHSIQNFFPQDIHQSYLMKDTNDIALRQFHTRMCKKKLDLEDYLFGAGKHSISLGFLNTIEQQLREEMLDIFDARS